MRALSLCATAVLVATTLQASAQQPVRPRATPPRTPPPAARRAAPAPPAAQRADAVVPFRVGETLTYDVAWSNYLVAGSAVSRVVEKRPTNNSTAYYIVAEGRPIPLIARFYAVYYKMDSLLDTVSTLSQRTSLYTEEGSRKRSSATTFNRSARRAQFEMQGESAPVKDEFAIPQNVQDGLATLYTLRTRTFKAGDRVTIPVADEGSLYTANFDVSGPETIKVPMGQVDAWKLRITILDGANQPVGQNIGAWISTDARRLPVRLQADLPVGNFGLALRSAQ
jgi:hypothetical protein